MDTDELTENGQPEQESPNRHIGERASSLSGMEMEIIGWHNSGDITVRFENGVIRRCQYSSFRLGNVSPYPNGGPVSIRKAFEHVGETNIDKISRMRMVISRYRNTHDISVRFENGTEVNCSYRAFKRGRVTRPSGGPSRKKQPGTAHCGETVINSDGAALTIIGFVSDNDISVRFEDGTEISHTTYEAFRSGSIRHPIAGSPQLRHRPKPASRQNSDTVRKTAGTMIYDNENSQIYRGIHYWKCHCTLCGYTDYLTVEQMRRHNCRDKQNSTQNELKNLAEKIGRDMEF